MVRVIGLSLLCAVSLNAQIFIFGDTHSSTTTDKALLNTLEIGQLVFTSSASNQGDIKSLSTDSVALSTLVPKSSYVVRQKATLSKSLSKTVRAVQVSKAIHKGSVSAPLSHPKKTDASKYLVH